MNRNEITEQIVVARLTRGLTWQELADAIDRPVMWTTSALLGQHPIPPELGKQLVERLGLDQSVVPVLAALPMRGGLPTAVPTDPTIYRFYEARQGVRGRHQRTDPRAIRRRHHECDQLQRRPTEEAAPVGRPRRRNLRRQIPCLRLGFRRPTSTSRGSPPGRSRWSRPMWVSSTSISVPTALRRCTKSVIRPRRTSWRPGIGRRISSGSAGPFDAGDAR